MVELEEHIKETQRQLDLLRQEKQQLMESDDGNSPKLFVTVIIIHFLTCLSLCCWYVWLPKIKIKDDKSTVIFLCKCKKINKELQGKTIA